MHVIGVPQEESQNNGTEYRNIKFKKTFLK